MKLTKAQQNPFQRITHIDKKSNKEYWLARELMVILGYIKWEAFCEAITGAIMAYESGIADIETMCNRRGKAIYSSDSIDKHILKRPRPSKDKTQGEEEEDYKLSRLGCYLVAMNGDPSIPEVASAQMFFAYKAFQMQTIESIIPISGLVTPTEILKFNHDKGKITISTMFLWERLYRVSHGSCNYFGNKIDSKTQLAKRKEMLEVVKKIEASCIEMGKEQFFEDNFFEVFPRSNPMRVRMLKAAKEGKTIEERPPVAVGYEMTEEGFSFFLSKYQIPEALTFEILEEFRSQKRELENYFAEHILKSPLKQDCLYIVRHPMTGFVKIGITADLESRMSQLAHTNGVILEILHVIDTPKARMLENYLHRKFSQYKQVGEWFLMNPEIIEDELLELEFRQQWY